MKSPIDAGEHKAEEKDDLNEKKTEEGYYGVQAEKRKIRLNQSV